MKLPEISYGRATPMQGRGPGEAVVKARGINEISSALTDSVNAIHEINNNYKISQATLRADNDLSAIEQEYGSREFFTADEVKRFNLEGQVPLTEGEGLEREVIPAHEVYPLLVDRQYEDSIKTHAQNIRRPKDREKWNMEMTMRRNDRVTQEVQRAEENAIQFTLKERMMDVTEAQASGNFDGAAMLINEVWAHDPGERREMLLENSAMAFERDTNATIFNGSDEDLENLLTDMKQNRDSVPMDERGYVVMLGRASAEKKRRDIEAGRYEALAEKERLAIAKDSYDRIYKAVSLGVEVPADEWQKAESASSGTDYADEIKRLGRVSQFTILDRETREEALSSMNNFDSIDDYGAMKAANDAVNKAAYSDPMGLAIRQGIVEQTPVDIRDRASVERRMSQAQAVSDYYGVPASPFTQGEVRQMTATIPAMTTGEQVNMAMAYSDMPEIWPQFAKSGASVFAWAGASGDENLAYAALSGQKKIDNKLVIPPSDKDYKLLSADYLGDVFGPDDQRAILDTAKAVYAEIAPTGSEGDFDSDAWETALEQVTGGMGEINGQKVVIPRGTDPDILQDYVDSFDADKVRQFGGVAGYSDEEAASLINDALWRSVGPGQYRVNIGNTTLFTPEGKPFIVTYDESTAMDQKAREYSRGQQESHRKLYRNPRNFKRVP